MQFAAVLRLGVSCINKIRGSPGPGFDFLSCREIDRYRCTLKIGIGPKLSVFLASHVFSQTIFPCGPQHRDLILFSHFRREWPCLFPLSGGRGHAIVVLTFSFYHRLGSTAIVAHHTAAARYSLLGEGSSCVVDISSVILSGLALHTFPWVWRFDRQKRVIAFRELHRRYKRGHEMCIQIDNMFSCGHRSFKRFDNCERFGTTCFGAGPNHRNETVLSVCKDCKAREKLGQSTTPVTPLGGSPSSNGSAPEERKIPWGAGDPWRRKG